MQIQENPLRSAPHLLVLSRVTLMFIRRIVTLTISLLVAVTAGAQTSLGPFVPKPALTIYIVGDGQPATAHVTINRASPSVADRIMFRVFDPDERLISKQYVERASTTQNPWLDQTVNLPASGVYQIRVTSGNSVSSVGVTLSRSLHWGVSFQNGTYSGWTNPPNQPNQPATLYAYVPPKAETFQLGFVPNGVVTIKDGAKIIPAVIPDKQDRVEVNVPRTNVIWTFTFSTAANWSFRAADFPLILCPTPEAAAAIRASVEVMPDGTVVCHKFQRRILETLPGLLTRANVGDVDLDHMVKRLIDTKPQWLADPERNGWLLHEYSIFRRVDPALRYQNVDPKSHWAGAMGTGDNNTQWWKWRLQQTAPVNRWDRLKSIGLWAGTSLRENGENVALAHAVTIDGNFNPYYGDTRILNRAAVTSLSDLLVLGEDEAWRDVGSDLDPYPGNSAFPIGQKTLETFSLVGPRITPALRDLWAEGLRRLLDRQYPMYLTTARNQSSHFLTAFQQFAIGTGKEEDAQAARAYARRFIQELSPAGYPMESNGPDTSYAGMSHYHMAVYAREANDQVMLDAIQKSYRFFNHTVAPEPNGSMLGAYNFSHRVADSFANEQWMGARGITADIPEVALWPVSSGGVTDSRLNNTTPSGDFATSRYHYYRQPNASGILPAREGSSFTRNFGNELIAVKRPSYYAGVFVGKPVPPGPSSTAAYLPYKSAYQQQEIAGETTGGTVPNIRQITPYLGGGLSLFWTPAYGNALLATNWAPTTHHGLIATEFDGAHRYWEDYFATQFQLDNNILKITGKIESHPVTYTRTYTFRDNEIVLSLQLTATANVQFSKLVETLPLAAGGAKPGTQIQVPGESGGQAVTQSFNVVNNANSGMTVLFDQPTTVKVQRNGLKSGSLQINRVEIVLPSQLQKGQTVTLNYRLRPTEARATPGDTIPALTATPGNTLVTLNWSPVSGATGYNIKKGLVSGQHPQILNAEIQGTSYVDSDLTNATNYYYVVSASGPWGTGGDSNEASATPAALPQLVSAVSRKTHGATDYEIPIAISAQGAAGVECRSGGAFKLVATFQKPVFDGQVTVASGEAGFNGRPTFAGNTMTINLIYATTPQTLQINLANVKATDETVLASAVIRLRILTGDVDANGAVNAADITPLRAAYGTSAGNPAFNPRADIDCNGVINAADLGRIRDNYASTAP